MTRPMDDIAMKPPEPVSRQEGVALWRQIANRLQHDIGARQLSAGRAPADGGGACPSISVSIATPCAARWRNCRAAAWCAWSRGAARSSPRTCWNTQSRRARDSPNGSAGTTWSRRGACCSLGRRRPIRTSPPALGIRAGSTCRAAGAAGLRRRPAGQPVAALLPVCETARRARRIARPHRRITEALKAVGVSDYLRQMTRVTARLPNAGEAELLRMPRNRPLLVTENINVDRDGHGGGVPASRAIQRRACRSSSNPESECDGKAADHRRAGAVARRRRTGG